MTGLDLQALRARMQRNAHVIDQLCDVDARQSAWRPARDKWSLLEVLCHLIDEEVDDFGTRVRRTLEAPEEAWDPIDPEGWVRERDYAARDLATMRAEFQRRREASLLWLGQLGPVDWERAHQHPKLGALRAGDLMLAWLVHDQLHIKQLSQLHADYHAAHAAPFNANYALP